jgi:RNA recognition motif-containing protein
MKLYVGNLASTTTQAQIDELVKPFGTASPSVLITDKLTGRSRGFAFVEFANDAAAQAAIAGLNGKEVDGSVLTVNEARQRKNERAAR